MVRLALLGPVASLAFIAAPLFADPSSPASPPATAPAEPAESFPAAPPGAQPLGPSPPAPVAVAGSPRFDTALVHVAVNYPGAILELRSFVDSDDWKPVCAAPCDRLLVTLGMQARVSAPGMTRSNAFRIEPGPGAALVKVSGGSATLRSLGIAGLVAGIPLGLVGTGMLSYGKYSDKDGLAIAGSIVLGTGALALLAAIPMLIASTTNVRDAQGRLVATSAPATSIE
ncbi:MAG TPA: hypothetical protein VMS65_16355 [Polyangiaceae bacterium]|nr:hypothetical protein [Polyangiaceae bacterium]